jgi:hypothetical protein
MKNCVTPVIKIVPQLNSCYPHLLYGDPCAYSGNYGNRESLQNLNPHWHHAHCHVSFSCTNNKQRIDIHIIICAIHLPRTLDPPFGLGPPSKSSGATMEAPASFAEQNNLI